MQQLPNNVALKDSQSFTNFIKFEPEVTQEINLIVSKEIYLIDLTAKVPILIIIQSVTML